MALRFRRSNLDIENGEGSAEVTELLNRNGELEILVSNLKQLLDISRHREKKLVAVLQEHGGSISFELDKDENSAVNFEDSSFINGILNRGGWLIGLLIFQSCSSFILASNEQLLHHHPTIIYYLTMLVGAGGNAGNQATVRVIRELAIGNLRDSSRKTFLLNELSMALVLSGVLGAFGFLRVHLFDSVPYSEAVAISLALILIVFISIVVGAVLPMIFHAFGLDPANSSTSIQVIMDISGVLITCLVATLALGASTADLVINS